MAETTTASSEPLGRIFRSLADFTVLTRHLRVAVDAGLARHLAVTGWQDGVLRVHLGQPALATRWRFQEPGVRRTLSRHACFAGLREIRLSLTTLHLPGERPRPAGPSPSLVAAPADALLAMAATESHPALRRALEGLGHAAEQARREALADRK